VPLSVEYQVDPRQSVTKSEESSFTRRSYNMSMDEDEEDYPVEVSTSLFLVEPTCMSSSLFLVEPTCISWSCLLL